MRHTKKSGKDKSNGYKHKHDKFDRIKEDTSVDNEDVEEEIEVIKNLPEEEFNMMFEKMLVSYNSKGAWSVTHSEFKLWPRAASRSTLISDRQDQLVCGLLIFFNFLSQITPK